MEIRSSIEVRWFLDDVDGPEAKAARAWFADVAPQPRREDRYLLTGREDIGFKARAEGGAAAKLETKYLVGGLGPALLHDHIVGNVERWKKLSLAANDSALERDGEWIRIAKTRRMRKFACEGRVVEPINASVDSPAGALVELTELELPTRGRRTALTIAIDVFGPDERLLDILLRTCEVALEPAKGLTLGCERSVSYPRWLARLG